MPSLDQLTASQVVKLLLIGDSGTGKTGSIASLVKDGYDVRLLDMDNGWESLAAAIRRECPDRLSSVQVECLRDRYKSTPIGPVLDGPPTAFVRAIGLLDKWGSFGSPRTWGSKCVVVVDSLTFFADAAYAWADALNPNAKDKRQIYGAAQEAVEHVLALLTGADFNTNVIVTAHVRYIDLPDGTKRGYPTAVGSALSPTIPRYFNSVAACATQIGGKRTIQTVSTALIDLKNPKGFDMAKSLPIETGLATFFETLRGKPEWNPIHSTPSPSTPSQAEHHPAPTSLTGPTTVGTLSDPSTPSASSIRTSPKATGLGLGTQNQPKLPLSTLKL
jgi:GTPase SAR1 family protein